jgi:hypothetical protein
MPTRFRQMIGCRNSMPKKDMPSASGTDATRSAGVKSASMASHGTDLDCDGPKRKKST